MLYAKITLRKWFGSDMPGSGTFYKSARRLAISVASGFSHSVASLKNSDLAFSLLLRGGTGLSEKLFLLTDRFRKNREMTGGLIAAALLAASGLSARVPSSDMECSHYTAMKADGQMAVIDSMRSRMPTASKMPSTHQMAGKVAASCKKHPGTMVHEAMLNKMPH